MSTNRARSAALVLSAFIVWPFLSNAASAAGTSILVAAAAKANIPLISESGTSTDPHAVNVQGNPYLLGAQTATALVNIMHHKGNLLVVDGVPGLSIATFSLAAAKQIFANCPQIKVVGEAGTVALADTAVVMRLFRPARGRVVTVGSLAG